MIWHDRQLRKFMRTKGFIASVDLMTTASQPVRFVLWDTAKHFQKAERIKDKDTIGRFYGGSGPACLGLICLCLDRIGGGILTHELFHLAEHLQSKGWESEEIADNLQELTASFWDWFYENFEQ